jgi:ribosomal protein S18 acetylase RimI-like enzyme
MSATIISTRPEGDPTGATTQVGQAAQLPDQIAGTLPDRITGTLADQTAGTRLDEAVGTLAVAFAADPVIRWLLPDGARYVAHFPRLLRLVGDAAAGAGAVDTMGSGAGAALWIAPGTHLPEEEFAGLLQQSVEPTRLDDAFALFEQMGLYHPEQPHWYLPFIGVDPLHQGRGHGSALLRTSLARCDRDGLPAYLEASSARNRALYERHDFQVVAEVRVADCPPLWPMWRPAS